ncbi:MAG: S-layer homology domain-containing protein [Oscillospiraceae bacterium]|jgi:hypothetical protein|nr:S-layer homology domain-containing protein [Oscillospiraceae bacterium]
MYKRVLSLFISALVICGACVTGGARTKAAFADIATSEHKAAIEFCAEHGFILGKSATEFDPDATLTREQFATIWARTFHVRAPHTFDDVTHVTAGEVDNSIIVMHALGFFNGESVTHYGRHDPITREQVATVLARTYLPGIDGDDRYEELTDAAAISDYARDGVSACLEMNLLGGIVDDGAFMPKQAATRGEVCRFLYNLMYDEAGEATPEPSETIEGTPTPEPSEPPIESEPPVESLPPDEGETTPEPEESVLPPT